MNSINNTPKPKPEIPPPFPDTIPLPEKDPSQKAPFIPVPDEIGPVNPEPPNKNPDLPEIPTPSEPPEPIPSTPHPNIPFDPIDSA